MIPNPDRRSRFSKVAGLALLTLAASIALDASPGAATPPGLNGNLGCGSARGAGGNSEVFTFNPSGTELSPTNLTNNAASDSRPRFSPDGREVVFDSNRDGGNELYLMNADGTNVRQLTFGGASSNGAWHPDGSQIVFQRNVPGFGFEVFKIGVDGTGETRLTNNSVEDSLPVWSPDGTAIALSSRQSDPATDVHLMTSFGSITSNVTNSPGEDSSPTWSPDGSQLGFHSRLDDAAGEEIYRIRTDGTSRTRLTFNNTPQTATAFDIFPTWSPDGLRIAWNSGRSGPNFGEIHQMNAVTGDTDIVRVTNDVAIDQRCDWQPLCTIYGSGDIVGTSGDDVICGSAGADRISAGGGNDRVLGLGGNDQIVGGAGNDALFGGTGNDAIVGGTGSDFQSGGPGSDRIAADGGERIDPGAGTDQCSVNGAAVVCPPRLS